MHLTNNELAAKITTELLSVEHHLDKLHKLLDRAKTRATRLGLLEPVMTPMSGGSGDDKPLADDPGIPG